jgi:hypothetical protein
MPEGVTPQLKPLKVAEYDSKQSKYKHIAECGKLPVRGCVLAPSSGGKTQLLANLILDVYRGCFERWYIFSPLCKPGLDTTWDEVRKYVYGEMGTPEEEECFFWEWDPSKLAEIIEKQEKIVMHLRKNGKRKMFNIGVILDDYADRPDVFRNPKGSKVLQTLAVSGRHRFISTWWSTQAYRMLHNTIRKNCTHNYVFRLRNASDLKAWIEENAGVYDEKTLMKLYRHAVDYEPYSFLYADLTATDVKKMFMRKFESFLVPIQNGDPS